MTLAGLCLRNLARHRARVILTVIGVAVTVMTFVLLRTVVWAWTVSVDTGSPDRIATRHKVSFALSLPKRTVDAVRAVPGVRAATWMSYFGGKDVRDERSFFASMAVDQTTFLDVYREVTLSPEARQRWRDDRQGAIVGEALARRMGVREGDTVTLRGTIYPGDWEFHVAGVYGITASSFDRSMFLFRWDYLNERSPEARRDQVGWILSRVDDPRAGPAVSRAIDRLLEDGDPQTLTMSERALNHSFLAMFGAVLGALDVVSLVILAIMALILGNTIAMGARERGVEHGVMRALGFGARHIALLVVGEGVLVGLLGGLGGVLLGGGLVTGVARWVEDGPLSSVFPFFRVQPSSLALALAFAVALAAAASLLPALRASRLRPIEALRRVD